MVITVTGSTGTIGTELVRLLSEQGAATRAILRNPARLRTLAHVAWTVADLAAPDVLEPALAGTTRLFVLTGNKRGFARTQIQLIEAARRAGVEHVVKLSALGASGRSNSGIGREHWDVEQALQESGMSWTILRPHTFMQNWLGEVADTVRAEGVIYSPVGDGRVPFIDARDIAAVALQALLHPTEHAGQKYTLTGGQAVGFADLAAALSTATGREVRYQPLTMDEARERMAAKGISAAAIDSLLAIAAYQRAGGGATAAVSPHVEQVLRRPPRSIEDFVRAHASYFTPPSE